METLIEAAARGKALETVERTAELEGVPVRLLLEGLADGTVVIPANATRKKK